MDIPTSSSQLDGSLPSDGSVDVLSPDASLVFNLNALLHSYTGVDLKSFSIESLESFKTNLENLRTIEATYNQEDVRAYFDQVVVKDGPTGGEIVYGTNPETSNALVFKNLVTDAAILLHELDTITLFGRGFASGQRVDFIILVLTRELQRLGYNLNSVTQADGTIRTLIDTAWVSALQDIVGSHYSKMEGWVEQTHTSVDTWLTSPPFEIFIDPDFSPTLVKRLFLAKELKRVYEAQALHDEVTKQQALGVVAFTTNITPTENPEGGGGPGTGGGLTFIYKDLTKAGIVIKDTGVFIHEYGHALDITGVVDTTTFSSISFDESNNLRSDAVPEDFINRTVQSAKREDFASTYELIAKFGFDWVRTYIGTWASSRLLQKIDWMEQHVFPSNFSCLLCE